MTNRANPWRTGPKGRVLRPHRQGDLDGLCGVYSVVNACRSLCSEIDTDTASWLFDHLMQSLDLPDSAPLALVTGGIGRRQLSKLIKAAIDYVDDAYEIPLAMARLPKPLRQSSSLDDLWRALAEVVTPGRVAVLGLGGRENHWTVAVGVTSHQIRLADSGRLCVLRRSQCTVGKATKRYSVPPSHVFLIERREAV
jgi:hypothetical protein